MGELITSGEVRVRKLTIEFDPGLFPEGEVDPMREALAERLQLAIDQFFALSNVTQLNQPEFRLRKPGRRSGPVVSINKDVKMEVNNNESE